MDGSDPRSAGESRQHLAAKAFEGGHLRLYERLSKAEGSALCQVCTEKIGLRRFLIRRKVPGVASPACPCRRGDQIAAHLFTKCTDNRSRGLRAFGYVYYGKRDTPRSKPLRHGSGYGSRPYAKRLASSVPGI